MSAPTPTGGGPTRVGRTCLVVGVVVAGWAMLAIPARATYNARTTADEPQYLLSALSLAEDRDLWIDDELADHRYEPFHEVLLPVQTEPRDDGRAVSPHDPLLPVVLAVPMGLGGWAAAKATLAFLAGPLAALLTWTAHRRFDVPLRVAAGTVLAFGLTAPLTSYATQIYPELPAALAVTVVIAALAAPRHPPFFEPKRLLTNQTASRKRVDGAAAEDRSPSWAWLVATWAGIVSLPWLGVKYAPVAGVLALLCLVRLWRSGRLRSALALAVGFVGAGAVYLVGHRLIYGGWTVYAAGDHFVGGELDVVGSEPDYWGRSNRLVGLLLDRSFGLAAWMPGYLLAVPALAALVRRRPSGQTMILLVPLAAGWATATWVALTMHGWWWPGRQTVVVLPCMILAVAWWVGLPRPVGQVASVLAPVRRSLDRPPGAGSRETVAAAVGRPRRWRRFAAGAVRAEQAAPERRRWLRPLGAGSVGGRSAVLTMAAVVGAVSWLWLVVEAWGRHRTLIVDFDTTSNPLYRAWRLLLPDYQHPDTSDWLRHAAWLAGLGLLARQSWRSAASGPTKGSPPPGADATEPAPVPAPEALTPAPARTTTTDAGNRAVTAAATPVPSVPKMRRRPTHVPA